MGAYQRVLVPDDGLLFVGIGVLVTSDGASLAAEQTMKVRPDLVSLALLQGVTLGASGLEEVGTLLGVTYEKYCQRYSNIRACQEPTSPYLCATAMRTRSLFY